MKFVEGASRELFGREIPRILLTHANPLNAECLPEILERLEACGYRSQKSAVGARPDLESFIRGYLRTNYVRVTY